MVKIVCEENTEGKWLVLAMPTIGHVPELAITYAEEKNALKKVGYVYVENSPIALIYKGKVEYPISLLSTNNAIILLSYLPLDKNIEDSIIDWYKHGKFKGIIILETIPVEVREAEDDVFYISEKVNDYPTDGLKKMEEGVLVGSSASLLLRLANENIPTFVLLAESHVEMPDGIAAANLLKALEPVLGKIDTEELIKDYKRRLSKIHKLVTKYKEQQVPEDLHIFG